MKKLKEMRISSMGFTNRCPDCGELMENISEFTKYCKKCNQKWERAPIGD